MHKATCDPEILFCSHALNWLLETNYLKGSATLHNVQIHRAVLTAKGLEALNATPNFGPTKSLGGRLVDIVAETGKEAGRAAIGEIVGQVIGAAARNFLTPAP